MPRLRTGRLRNSWFSSRQVQETSVLSKTFRPTLEPTSLLFSGYWELFTLGQSGLRVKLTPYRYLFDVYRVHFAYTATCFIGCEILCLCLCLREEHRLNLLQNKAPRRIFGSKKQYWEAGECCIMSLYTPHRIPLAWLNELMQIIEDLGVTLRLDSNTVEPGYNDIGLCDTPYITSDILWYLLISHC